MFAAAVAQVPRSPVATVAGPKVLTVAVLVEVPLATSTTALVVPSNVVVFEISTGAPITTRRRPPPTCKALRASASAVTPPAPVIGSVTVRVNTLVPFSRASTCVLNVWLMMEVFVTTGRRIVTIRRDWVTWASCRT